MAALQNLPATWRCDHDSVAVGDGPTHEPIEQSGACVQCPTLMLSVPDGNETNAAWKRALQTERVQQQGLDTSKLASPCGTAENAETGVNSTSSQKLKVILMVSSLRLVLK